MNFLIRWGATLGLIGSTLLGSVFSSAMPAWALNEDQIVEKLREVPVFTITDAEGSPLVASITNGDNTVTESFFFISYSDAEAFIERLKTEQPDLAGTVRVTPYTLAQVYLIGQEIANTEGDIEETPDSLRLIPTQDEVQEAMSILQTNGEEVQEFPGVPVFLPKIGDDSYLSIQEGERQWIPMFFERDQIDNALEQFKLEQPDLAESVSIEVTVLEGVIQTMKDSDDPELEKILLVPPQETIEFLQSLPREPQQ
ncbi:MAG: Tic22 family protein [Geitlerinemataceae cyanobacterium]